MNVAKQHWRHYVWAPGSSWALVPFICQHAASRRCRMLTQTTLCTIPSLTAFDWSPTPSLGCQSYFFNWVQKTVEAVCRASAPAATNRTRCLACRATTRFLAVSSTSWTLFSETWAVRAIAFCDRPFTVLSFRVSLALVLPAMWNLLVHSSAW